MAEQAYQKIAQDMEQEHGVVSSQMFGKPCLKIDKKAFAAFQAQSMVFKVGREAIKVLQGELPGSELWDPSRAGRPMKDWLRVPFEHASLWSKLAQRAMVFVSLD